MSAAWKQFERDAAALFGGTRFWANSGERADFDGWTAALPPHPLNGATREVRRHKVRGQCKLVKTLSLAAMTRLLEQPAVEVLCVKLRRGRGRPSPPLVVMTFDQYRRLHR